jgi:hypothetical protein
MSTKQETVIERATQAAINGVWEAMQWEVSCERNGRAKVLADLDRTIAEKVVKHILRHHTIRERRRK